MLITMLVIDFVSILMGPTTDDIPQFEFRETVRSTSYSSPYLVGWQWLNLL